MIRCGDGSLYTGITTDVDRRFAEHAKQGPKCAKYLRGRGPFELAYSQSIGSKQDALRKELEIKRLSKIEKEKLVAVSSRDLLFS